ncbi:hypothetical protein [Candidatus Parabeggiatoa sp. HSG14]|uniref:hypothetical protein n=1 Tax=Candidatus Parabeggiatoa sp. HSG14 TaxID=3055593 RepID=UPI0025A7AAA9|nr:hypothetical protein [Thiotrichales bacterium HSG14]
MVLHLPFPFFFKIHYFVLSVLLMINAGCMNVKPKFPLSVPISSQKKVTSAPKIKPIDPPIPVKSGESVFAIEKIECKSQHEALVLFYKGKSQHVNNGIVPVVVTKRYALWYDRRHQGVSKTDWWCIPKKRFCYSSIPFSDWGGKLKSNDISYFKKKEVMPSRFDITALAAEISKKTCHFDNFSQK